MIDKEYVASLIGLHKNNDTFLCVGIDFLLIWPLHGEQHGITFAGIPNGMQFCYRQIPIETATHS